MGYFTKQVVTNQGLQIMAQAGAEGGVVTFTRTEVGDGTYADTEIEQLPNVSQLKNKKKSYPVCGVSAENKTIELKTIVDNKGLTDGFYLREVGIFAQADGGNEVLFSVAVCDGDNTYIPEFKDIPVELVISNFIAYSGTGQFTIDYKSGACVSAEEFYEFCEMTAASLDGKVSKGGDKVSGELILGSGSIVAREAGETGVPGYVKTIQIKILREYVNYPIIFGITGRGWKYSRKLYVRFENINGTDPELSSFLIDNPAEYKVAIIKSDTSTWDIYMQKCERYSNGIVCSMSNTNYADAVQITFPDTLVSTLPDGVIEPTVIIWEKAKNADTVDGKHFSDIKELIDAKQNIRNGILGEGGDWNSVTAAGAYKVQHGDMTGDKHGIPGEYSYGILYVIDSEVGGETRILQMYFPHQPNISPIHIRMRNNGIWRDWVAVTSAIGATGNAATLGGMNKNQFVHRANPVLDGNVTCKKNIWFSGENGANTMIMFLDSGDNTGQGISIGGGGLTIIGGGESAGEIVNYYTNNRTVKAGGNENMIVANDGVIDFYTNCQSGFSGAKHITMNTDGTITALGLNGNATSASCVLDGGDKRKTYMKYSANCVDDFTYLAVWNPISGGVELRAFDKANLKDKLGLSNTPDYEEGTWSPGYCYTAGPTHFVFDYGKYTKIGNIVIASFGMSASPVSGEYYVYLSQSSLPWPMSATNFMSAEVHDVFNGKKYDGRMSGVISTIDFGKMQFTKQTSSAPTERYVGTIMYRI